MADTGAKDLFPEIDSLADVLQDPVVHWVGRLQAMDGSNKVPAWDAGLRAALLRLVGSSEFAARTLLRDWRWFCAALGQGELAGSPIPQSLIEQIRDVGRADAATDEVKRRLRTLRNRGLVRVLWRVVEGSDSVQDSLTALSALADGLIAASMESADRALSPRFGTPVADGRPLPLVTLAMGKLGGGELNFSSDIDLVFLYPREGETNGPRSLSAHEYFGRLTRHVVNLLDEVTADGFVYRVDTRLRPFGESGPPVVSFAALENYLLQHGRSWERYAYVKARVIAPGASADLIDDLQSTIIDPFVYRRYLDYGVFESLRDMKSLIETEVRKRELADNVKLGPGGIREIEFIVQSLQLVRGGADRQLRCRGLQTALRRLAGTRGLGHDAAEELEEAYEFLRRFENALQAIRDQQTHDVPASPLDRARLALALGYDSWAPLADALETQRRCVSKHFAAVAFRGRVAESTSQLADEISASWAAGISEPEWASVLAEQGFRDVDSLAREITAFASASVQRQTDASARKRLDQFMRTFLPILQSRERPAEVCARVLSVVARVLRRSAYVALLNENQPALEQLVDLCGESGYLAKELERFPALLDELLDPRLMSEPISRASMQEESRRRLAPIDAGDSEAMIEALARFQRATLFRIAVADISDALPIMKVSDRLTELAEIVLATALDIAWRDLAGRHGTPHYELDGRRHTAGFAVVAYGKLGGMELSYRSDLDIVFLHDSRGKAQLTDGAKPLDNSLFFGRLVRRLVHFLTTQTSSGALYDVDTRLRPSGRSGLLVVSTEGFARYQEDNAWTWEHQALLRSRPVAGSAAIGREFEKIRADTLQSRIRRDSLLEDVLSMRSRMRAQLDKSTDESFDLKQGEGGIGDIEFLVQYLVLRHAASRPELIYYSDNIRQLGALDAVGVLPAGDVARLQAIYRAYRLTTHRLALDDRTPVVPATEYPDEREFVRTVWLREMR
jgi:glutamate-ammonia-ligase adenylyltransferase